MFFMKILALVKVFHELNAARVRYLAVGGIAVIAHGYSRLTMDIDLVISLEPNNIGRALNVLSVLNYRPRIPVQILEFADPVKRRVWFVEKNMRVFSLFNHDPSMPMIDIFVKEPFDFEQEYEKAEAYAIDEDNWAPVVCLETLVEMKISANRDKDRIDVSNLKRIHPGEANEEN
jgi:hypothetical protein